jgi:hypothetical protein
MKRLFIYCLIIFATSFVVNAAENDALADVTTQATYIDQIEFKPDGNKNIAATFINIVLVTLVLLAGSIGVLLLVKKYKNKLPILANTTKSNVDLIEYKKLPGNVEIYLLKVYGEDLVLAKNNNNVVSMDFKRTDFNEKT